MNNQELRDYFATAAARDKERTKIRLELDRCAGKLIDDLQLWRNSLNKLANVDCGDAVHLAAHHDADGQPAKRKRADTKVGEVECANVFTVLQELSSHSSSHGRFKPSTLAGSLKPMGLKTIGAACKRLVAEGRATEHRGAYRIAPGG